MNKDITNIPPTKDLFAKHRITDVHVHYYPGRTFAKQANGQISFKHSSFESEKNFNGDDFDDVINQMRVFLESLDKQEEVERVQVK